MAATDLVTLEQVREYIQKTTGDTELDETLEGLITRLSTAIIAHCGRQFAPPVDSATHRKRVKRDRHRDGLYVVDLAPHDLRSASAVSLHPETATPVTLTADVDYLLEPAGKPGGVYTEILLRPASLTWSSTAALNFGFVNLDITGAWGFEDVPGDVQQACISAVRMYLDEASPFGGSLQPNSIGEGVNREVFLPPGIRGLLAHHVRTPVF